MTAWRPWVSAMSTTSTLMIRNPTADPAAFTSGVHSGYDVAHHRQHQMRCRLRCPEDVNRRRLVVGGLRLENVRHVRLRVAVDAREPRALHLDHDPVPLLK